MMPPQRLSPALLAHLPTHVRLECFIAVGPPYRSSNINVVLRMMRSPLRARSNAITYASRASVLASPGSSWAVLRIAEPGG